MANLNNELAKERNRAAAERTFEALLKGSKRGLGAPTVVPFTVMLKGYSGQGLVREARALLRRMASPAFAVAPNLRTANHHITPHPPDLFVYLCDCHASAKVGDCVYTCVYSTCI